MTIEHHLLSGAALHNSKILTFTGDPSAYVPPESGILVCCLTAPNAGKLYRTTGTSAGAVALLATGQDGAAATVSIGTVTATAPSDPPTVANSGTANAAVLDFTFPVNLAVATTFTGLPTAYTPAETGVLVVRTDVTPNQLYRTTGTTLGAVVAVGLADLDPDLTALAGLTTTGAIERTGDGTASTFSVTAFAKTLLDDADAATARGTLGLTIGTNVQAWSTRLDSVAGLSATSGGIEKTAANTFGTYTLTSFAKTLLDDADAATARGTLGLVIGTNVQGYDADLAAIAALATTGLIERTGAGTAATRTIGTANGNIPVVGAGGRLAESVIPGAGLPRGFVLFEMVGTTPTILLSSAIASVVRDQAGIFTVTLSAAAPGSGYFVPIANGHVVSSWAASTNAVWATSTTFTVVHTVNGVFTDPYRISAVVFW